MRIFLFMITALLYSSTSFSQTSASPVAADFSKLNWLVGNWNRTNTKPGRSGSERWTKVSNTELKGWGLTMKGADTSYVEKMQLLVKDNHIFFVADVPENKQPVYFTVTSLTANSFECENPNHDFPKKIAYQLEGNTIKAVISGNGKAIDYVFERK